MATLLWDLSYSVHVQQCDAQHQKLFAIIGDLSEAMRTGKGAAVISHTLDQLLQYTRTHFQEEEAMLGRTGYAALAVHQVQHRKFIEDIKKFASEIEGGGRGNSVAVMEMLRDWLVQHIMIQDKAYSQHLNAKGIH